MKDFNEKFINREKNKKIIMQLSKHRNTVELPLLGVQGGEAPCKKKRCHPEGVPAGIYARRISCRPHLQGRRGACTVEFNVNSRRTKVKLIC